MFSAWNTNRTISQNNLLFLDAAEKGHIPLAEQLLSSGVNPEFNHGLTSSAGNAGTALIVAAQHQQYAMVDFLLNKGVNVNAVDDSGLTALHYAVIFNLTSIVKRLISAGANLELLGKHCNKHRYTPLQLAAKGDNDEMITLLIESGANIETKNDLQQTALHIAASHGSLNALKRLLHHGANSNAIDLDKETPLDLAECKDKISIIKYLKEALNNPFLTHCDNWQSQPPTYQQAIDYSSSGNSTDSGNYASFFNQQSHQDYVNDMLNRLAQLPSAPAASPVLPPKSTYSSSHSLFTRPDHGNYVSGQETKPFCAFGK